MGQLLASCTSVKTVRLLLVWARENALLDVDDLRARYPLRTGSDKRWMSRMPDGTLLTLKPQQWLPPIWGHTQAQGMVPAAQSLQQINRILELVMRHFNSIIAALEDERPDIYPHWSVMEFAGREFDDAECQRSAYTGHSGVGVIRPLAS